MSLEGMFEEELNEIERHKGVFEPDRTTYLWGKFTYTCKFLEEYDKGPRYVEPFMHFLIQEDLAHTKHHYFTHDKPTKFYTSGKQGIEEQVMWDLKEDAHHQKIVDLERKLGKYDV